MYFYVVLCYNQKYIYEAIAFISVSTCRNGESFMPNHKKKKSRPNKSYVVVKEGSSTKRPAPPGRAERESQDNENPPENLDDTDREE